ncbi:MAG: hypothetical protein HND44_05615 [Chloroflexi bacterium]|nr:hypothetical protein [Ardenticatenaceae bacterium]MBL1127968.1 hypothetical protein [Chloroflexota bacterium]NOG34040.1 hypothetical protein [Chloroflexota bacterium]GIK54458.1 MAG: hypothetical protein BroJett015_01210 [Chloroflexota bacterium]
MTEETETKTAVTPTPPTENASASATPPPASTPTRSPSRPAAAAPTTPARDPVLEERAIRRGCFSIIFGAALGAIVGAALTLALLAWMNNGLLTYNDANVTLRMQLDGEIATREALAAEQATAIYAMDEASNRMNETMATAEADMAALRVTAVYLETRIASAGNASDTLNEFISGLSTVLLSLTPAPTTLPEATPTP